MYHTFPLRPRPRAPRGTRSPRPRRPPPLPRLESGPGARRRPRAPHRAPCWHRVRQDTARLPARRGGQLRLPQETARQRGNRTAAGDGQLPSLRPARLPGPEPGRLGSAQRRTRDRRDLAPAGHRGRTGPHPHSPGPLAVVLHRRQLPRTRNGYGDVAGRPRPAGPRREGEPQSAGTGSWAGFFKKDYATVDWSAPATHIHTQVRAWNIAGHHPRCEGPIAVIDGTRWRLRRTTLDQPRQAPDAGSPAAPATCGYWPPTPSLNQAATAPTPTPTGPCPYGRACRWPLAEMVTSTKPRAPPKRRLVQP
ncbi:hypothetical protein BZZ08_00505 [Streptomyces sp. MH60]|nr:hypothetical protein BZZ08_00505 [Streptomyces sp. MH60]